MLSRIRSRLTYANVVASLSLFLVLSGGTAVALTGSNTVFSDDIVDGQVKAADLGPGSVAGSEVKNDSLTGADIEESSLRVGVMGGVMKNVSNSDVASGTQWAPSGASTASTTGPFVAPAGGFAARGLEISLASPNGAGESHTFELGSLSGSLSCTVPENASSCSDTTHTVTVSAGQPYSIQETAVANSARTVDVRFGWRATSP